MTLGLFAIMLEESAYVERWHRTVARMATVGGGFDRVVVIDGGSTDNTVERLQALGVEVIRQPFDKHYANQRNLAMTHCPTDWLLEIDADEIPSLPLLANLRGIIADAERTNMDCIGIPRLNFLDGQLVLGPGYKGLDPQYRLHNRQCHWRGAVHEELVGYRCRFELPLEDGHFLIHDKSADRHAARNAFYRSLTP